MIYPLLPVFLTTVLGASAGFIGAIEGAAESTAALLKLASGWWSDRMRRRKPLVVAGYTLASVVRPLVAVAQSATQVLLIRVSDRVGKGLRNSPRDALDRRLGRSEHARTGVRISQRGGQRGRAARPADRVRSAAMGRASRCARCFGLSAIPGAIAVIVAIVGVREVASDAPAAREGGAADAAWAALLGVSRRDLRLHARQLDRRVSACCARKSSACRSRSRRFSGRC